MATPTVIDIPHSLGRDEAKRRIASRIGDLPQHIPGGVAQFATSWPGEYIMALEVAAMAQQVSATLDIEERTVRVTLVLPGMLSFMSGVISAAIRSNGERLLLGHDA